MIYIKKIQNKIRYLSNLNKLKKENKKLGNIILNAGYNLIGTDDFSIKIDEYEVKISSFNNAVTIYIQNFGTIKTFKFVHMSASFLLDGFDKQATYENSGVIFNKYSNDDWKNNLRYNTDEIEIFELHKKLNLALNLSNKAYISLNKLKKENELNAFKHEMNKLKTNFH